MGRRGKRPWWYRLGEPFARRCNQCNKLFSKLTLGFNQRTKTWFKNCPECRIRTIEGTSMPTWRTKTPKDEPLKVWFIPRSGNRKTGPIPVSTSVPSTCPKSCAWYGKGCYGESGYMAGYWKKLAGFGMEWETFCQEVEKLPAGQLWRHNILGDLPGKDEHVDADKLARLVWANLGKMGFCFTHKKSDTAIELATRATSKGFTVNLSCDSLEEVDRRSALGQGPLTLVVPADETRKHWRSPAGLQIVRCPATHSDIDCAACKLCAKGERKSVVAFPAHGHAPAWVSQLSVQYKLPLVQ